jgi:predicted RNA-binding Zn ribbon-like protein
MVATEEASGEVRLVLDFLNTIDVEQGTEELGDDRALAAWLRAHDLPTRGADAGAARAVRDALRLSTDEQVPRADALAAVPLHVAFDAQGLPLLRSTHPLGAVLAAVVRLVHEGEWSRIKLCRMHDCRYAFYDTSRNRSGRWCSMRVCGNRAKTRAFRERHRS